MDHNREDQTPPLARVKGVGRQQQQPTYCLIQPICAHGGEFESFCFRGELGFLNCDDMTMTKFILKNKTSFEAYKRYIYIQIQ